jgi:hypothetical protein
MKKKLLLCSLGLILAGLLAANQAWAFSFVGKGDLPDSGLDTEKAWLEGLPGVTTGHTLTKIEPINWSDPFNYGAGTYVILKTGNLDLNPINYDHFAFNIGSSVFADYTALITAMLSDLEVQTGIYGKSVDWWKGKASHFTIATPIPSAVLLFGSGILGLVGIRMRSRRKS